MALVAEGVTSGKSWAFLTDVGAGKSHFMASAPLLRRFPPRVPRWSCSPSLRLHERPARPPGAAARLPLPRCQDDGAGAVRRLPEADPASPPGPTLRGPRIRRVLEMPSACAAAGDERFLAVGRRRDPQRCLGGVMGAGTWTAERYGGGRVRTAPARLRARSLSPARREAFQCLHHQAATSISTLASSQSLACQGARLRRGRCDARRAVSGSVAVRDRRLRCEAQKLTKLASRRAESRARPNRVVRRPADGPQAVVRRRGGQRGATERWIPPSGTRRTVLTWRSATTTAVRATGGAPAS